MCWLTGGTEWRFSVCDERLVGGDEAGVRHTLSVSSFSQNIDLRCFGLAVRAQDIQSKDFVSKLFEAGGLGRRLGWWGLRGFARIQGSTRFLGRESSLGRR
jgi:hypothetical protein